VKTSLVLVAAAALVALSGCATVTRVPIAASAEHAPQKLVGTWDVRGSTAQYAISTSNSSYYIEAIDTQDQERFRLSDFRWNGRLLTGVSVMPSTHWTTYQSLTLTKPDRLEGRYRGDQKTGREIWLRRKTRKTSNHAMQRTADRPYV
jgi:uncharacterized protein YceK